MARQLSVEQEAIVERILAEGEYGDADAVVTAALLLLEQRDRRLRWLQAEIQIGLDQIERGEVIEYTPELFKEMVREAEEQVRQHKPIRDAVEP